MNKSLILDGFRWVFILLVACVITIYGYKRFQLHENIQSSLHTTTPHSTIIGIIQTKTLSNKEKVYEALYKTKDGTCFRGIFERDLLQLVQREKANCK
ncbi:hypothetical protein [Rossellomorea aquimaris]|uniref:hypothetical protein n=1 Tax=Rossellomorea aquimaris TaxID=189382 RepID=UPI0007D0A695|nr:hypothetical protein [Rossellomorea aquimaris]